MFSRAHNVNFGLFDSLDIQWYVGLDRIANDAPATFGREAPPKQQLFLAFAKLCKLHFDGSPLEAPQTERRILENPQQTAVRVLWKKAPATGVDFCVFCGGHETLTCHLVMPE
jgi:hypothetical protein